MIRLLIADNEEVDRQRLQLALTRRGFAVETAASGRGAIDLGCRYRPRILIADWVLLDQVHGLQVAEVLRLVRPDLEVILMSGFGSADLEFEAGQVGVSDFVEKPFELERMVQAVDKAAAGGRRRQSSPIAVLETAANGEILYANPRADELLGEIRRKRGTRCLQQVLPPKDWARFDLSTREWIEVRPLAARSVAWQVRSRRRPGSEGYHVVLLRGDQCLAMLDQGPKPYRYDFLVRLLLELPVEETPRWPFAGRALMIDSSDMLRRFAVTEIERAGGMCHSVKSCKAAAEVFQRDPEIDIVLLDSCLLGPSAADLIGRIRARVRDVVIVGQGHCDSRRDFAHYGIERFLPSPWEIEDLILIVTT